MLPGRYFVHLVSYLPTKSWTKACVQGKSLASAGHSVVRFVTGPMVVYGDHRLLVPPTSCLHRDALRCGQCTRWQIQDFQTGSFSRRCGVLVDSCCGSGSPLCLDVHADRLPSFCRLSQTLFFCRPAGFNCLFFTSCSSRYWAPSREPSNSLGSRCRGLLTL